MRAGVLHEQVRMPVLACVCIHACMYAHVGVRVVSGTWGVPAFTNSSSSTVTTADLACVSGRLYCAYESGLCMLAWACVRVEGA